MAVKSLPEKTKLFIQLFYLHKKINAVKFKHIFGSKILDDLLKLNLLVVNGNNIKCDYSIKSLNDYYIVCEENDYSKLDYAYFSADSVVLARHLPLNLKATKVLDLCSGTGVQAILLARSGREIVGVELSREVANIARFNTILNNVENEVKILQGNLYEPVKNMKFDLIVSNPPFIPVPDTLQYSLCGRGGEDGLLVLRKIFDNISKYMAKNGISLILGMTYGNHHSPFVLNLLKKIAKRDKLNIDILVLERIPRWFEIPFRSSLLSKYNPKPDLQIKMGRIYSQAKADYLYAYLVKIRKSNYNVKLTNLFTKKSDEKETKISENTSLKSLYFQLVKFFMEGQYNKVISIHKNMVKFSKVFGLKYDEDVFFILGVSYKKLKQYKKAIIEFRKAEKINPEEALINFSIFECYLNIGQTKQADKELKKWSLKFKKV